MMMMMTTMIVMMKYTKVTRLGLFIYPIYREYEFTGLKRTREVSQLVSFYRIFLIFPGKIVGL